jgi:hypothetical protein
MSAQLGEEEPLFKRVEDLLEQGPSGQDEVVRTVQEELGSLRKDPDTRILEQIYQSFGTAVGQDSKISKCNILLGVT